ncbi:hypothetical protein [Labedaea rhizosphaerae]|uniref:Uncharacterized protein n=1 Tax=Labedaea rhizosphaerae TaxID=598644 RepID=A0A4R6SM48_LABRH|nr:hypothetical protein [Labedaea rhizosphaerae]TDQ04630.1 hypothetical protein EV186_101584 [Labedaea rhizosphaerae]
MSKEKDKGLGVRPGQVISAALAAVTAAVLGSTMGLAGTVIGAGLASVVTTVAGALYLRSLERTKAGVQLVRERVRSGVTGRVIIEREVTTEDRSDQAKPDGEEVQPTDRPPAARAIRWGAVVAGSLLAFVLGMLAITGYESLVGGSLSGGTGTTVGGVIHPKQQQQQQRQDDDSPAPTTTPGPSTKTVTVPADPTGHPMTSGSSTSTTTDAPPTTTTTPGGTTTTPPPTTTTPNGDVPSQ